MLNAYCYVGQKVNEINSAFETFGQRFGEKHWKAWRRFWKSIQIFNLNWCKFGEYRQSNQIHAHVCRIKMLKRMHSLHFVTLPIFQRNSRCARLTLTKKAYDFKHVVPDSGHTCCNRHLAFGYRHSVFGLLLL